MASGTTPTPATTEGDGRELLGRTLYDITQILESLDQFDDRVRRVLGLLRRLVPYEECALLQALGLGPHVVMDPETTPEERVVLTATLLDIFGQLVDPNVRSPATAAGPRGVHLAVPMVWLDEVIGLLFVRSSLRTFTEDHLRALSVVAAKLASYFTTARARIELAEIARQRDEARRAAEAANQIKDEFLALVSLVLKPPLTSILAWAQVLREPTSDGDARARALVELEHSALAQGRLIEDILDFTRINSTDQRLKLHFTAGSGPVSASIDKEEVPVDQRQLAGLRVLLVDRDLGVRESVESVLVDYGAQVTAVASAPEALAALERWRPDVLLFGDLATRGESVYDLMRDVTARACPLPIASISTWRFHERERELSAGFRVHLAMPLEIEALVTAVEQLAGRGAGGRRRIGD